MPEISMQISLLLSAGKRQLRKNSQYTANPILVTRSSFAGVVFVRPMGLVILELQTLNW